MPLPAPPPPPPPGPPPLGGLANLMCSSNVKLTPASSNNQHSPPDRSNLLNEIRKAGGMGGKIQLKKVVTNDRSSPTIGGNANGAKSSSPLSNGSSGKASTVGRALGNQMTNKMSFQEQLNSAIKGNKLSSSHSSGSIHSAISDGNSPQHAAANGNGVLSKNATSKPDAPRPLPPTPGSKSSTSPPFKDSMALDFAAGLVGGAAGVLVGHPFDTVKARLQTQHLGGLYRGTLHCFAEIARKESFLGLYKGISSPLAGLAFINAVVFSVYGTSLKYFSSLYGDNIKSYFCAGCSAGLIQSLICSPMELAKLRLQLQGQGVWARHILFYMDPPLPYSGPLDCLRKVYKLEGFRGIFRGLPLTVTRDGPCFGIYFASYEWLTRSMTSGGPETLTTANLLFAGGAAGMISWLFLYPIDVVKSRFQADAKLEYKNSWHCAKTSYKTEGWRVFSHGLPSALLRAFPTNAVTFFTVEWIFRLANGYSLSSATNNSINNSNNNYNRRTKENNESSAASASETKNYLFLPVPERNAPSPTCSGVGSSAMELTLFS